MRDGRMHQTTVRFSPDLWQQMEVECEALGVSVAQYLREAALARMAYSAGRAGDTTYGSALEKAGARLPSRDGDGSRELGNVRTVVEAAVGEAPENRLSAEAVGAQSTQVTRRARALPARSPELRRKRLESSS